VRKLDTERLTLEPVTPQNAAVLWRIMQGAHLRDYQDVPRLERDEFVRRVAARPQRFDGRAVGRFEWLIVVRRTKVTVGWVSLRVGDGRSGAAEIGYSIRASARGKGYATEAARAIVGVAFAQSNVMQVDACCVPENTPSRKLLASIGFEQLRLQPSGAVVRGRAVDICVYAMTRAQWNRYQASDAAAPRYPPPCGLGTPSS
jgi:ribosomal-protein-alanine N-acetyltransferase